MRGYEAIRLMVEEGKRVQKRSWKSSLFWEMADAGIIWVVDKAGGESFSSNFISLEYLLADDWEIVPRTMDFPEAMRAWNEGKAVRRHGWSHIHSHVTPDNYCGMFSFEDMRATDWIIVDEAD